MREEDRGKGTPVPGFPAQVQLKTAKTRPFSIYFNPKLSINQNLCVCFALTLVRAAIRPGGDEGSPGAAILLVGGRPWSVERSSVA